jgi:signal transduction histidine kinase
MNLLKNAIHAVDKKKYPVDEKPTLTLMTENAPNEILVRIKDNGTGMDEATMNRIFEPFFTTKEVGEGTGLGLSIVYNIIEKHDGTIDVESAPGIGTEFTIAIPKHQVKTDAAQKDKLKSMKAERRSRLVKNLKLSNN